MTSHSFPRPALVRDSFTASTGTPAQPVTVVLAALAGKLLEASRAAIEAHAALGRGEPVAAIGALLPTEQVIRDALALHTAAVVLHLEPG
ncbi:unnamed protein product [Gemmata massiliana]|uniref:Uncharacterized protein n=1 Tax=Gemmata massiliana TaxID=1210884 RepID=A0A6P2CVA8_9BACT|nr:hypothetical protein [Gemmata massiliana]VTR91644.1 unnamed protein product [Gemmata massiliana]